MTEVEKARAAMEADFKTAHMPQAVKDAIWNVAWDLGHAYGLYEVRGMYGDIADVALAYEAAK